MIEIRKGRLIVLRQMITNILNNTSPITDKIIMLQQMFDKIPAGITIISEGQFGANAFFYELTGLSKSIHTTKEYLSACPQDYVLYKEYTDLLSDNASFTRLYSITSADQTDYYIKNSTFLIKDNNQLPYYFTILMDRTELNNLSILFEECNDRFRILEGLMDEYVFEYDFSKDTLYFSERWKPDGINTEYPHAKKWLELHEIIHPEDFPFLLDAMNSTRLTKEPRTLEFRAQYLKSDYNWYRIHYRLVRSKHTNALRAIGKISDISKERPNTGENTQEGVDSRTGLYIPAYMQTYVDQILSEESDEQLCALMLLQLDNFADFKKSTGDLYTKHIEKQVANKLRHSFRNTDILGYSLDGCFMIFLRKVPEDIVTLRARDVLNNIKDITIEDIEEGGMSCSIGIGLAPLDGCSYMELFLKADSAMYLSKARGGNTFSYFHMETDARQRQAAAAN